jgi:hypothetical protein
MRLCCCIPDQSKLDERCQKQAEYEIWRDDTPDGATDACAEHLEQMLDDSPHFSIFRIQQGQI